MKTYIKTIFVLLFFSLFLFQHTVHAHMLKVDGSIGAVLHIDPDDDPIIGEPATFFFEFKDKQNIFKSKTCDCTVAILKNNKQIFSQPLFDENSDPNLTSPVFSFIFPEKAIYSVLIQGTPKQKNSFQSFTLTYDIRVDREATVSNSFSKQQTLPPHVIAVSIVFLVFLAMFMYERFQPKHTDIDNKKT